MSSNRKDDTMAGFWVARHINSLNRSRVFALLAAFLTGGVPGARATAETITWTGGAGTGAWATAGNWDLARAPMDSDDVIIANAGAAATVTYSSGTTTLNSLVIQKNTSFTAGTLGVTGSATLSAILTLNGGTLSGGAWDVTGGTFNCSTSNSSQLVNMVITGEIKLSSTNSRVKIGAGTTFTTARLSGMNSVIGLPPGYTLDGTILLQGGASGSRYVEMTSAGTLTIGPTGAIRMLTGGSGAAGLVGSTAIYGAAMTLTNQGLIRGEIGGLLQMFVQPGGGIVNQGSIEVSNGGILSVTTLSGNAGTLVLGATGGTLALNGAYTIDQNTTISSGATLTLNGTWSNAANISVAGTLNFGGAHTTPDLGTFTNTGGAVNITGSINNTGNTLTLDSTTGSVTLDGGSITGGTVQLNDGVRINASGDSANQLASVTINGELRLPSSGSRVAISGSTTFTTARLSGQSAAIGLPPGYVLNSTILLEGSASAGRYVEMTSAGTLTIGPTGAIRRSGGGSGSGATVGTTSVFSGAMTLINQGLIRGEVGGLINLTVQPSGGVTNQGTIEVSGNGILSVTTLAGNAGTILVGGSGSSLTLNGNYALNQDITVPTGTTLTLNGVWSNQALLNVTGGTLNLDGTFTTAALGTFVHTGGMMSITGTLDNTGRTLLLDATTGTLSVNGGTIIGGTVQLNDGNKLDAIGNGATNRLDGVTVNGEVRMPSTNNSVDIANGATFTTARLGGQSAAIRLPPGYVLNGTIILEASIGGDRYVETTSAGTLTIGAGGAIRRTSATGAAAGSGRIGATGGAMALVNNGLISAETNGTSFPLTVQASSFTNNGTVQATSTGRVTISSTTFANFASQTLTGGTYAVFANSQIRFTNANVVTNAANIVLDGASSNLQDSSGNNALANFVTNDVGGSFTIRNGRTFTMPGPMSNAGQFIVGPANTFALTSALSNSGGVTIDSSTLNGPATLTNGATGTLTGRGASINAPLVNQGLAVFENSGNTINGTFASNPLGATLRVHSALADAVNAALTIPNAFPNAGSIDLTAEAGSTHAAVLNINTGTIVNTGTIKSSAGTGHLLNAAVNNQGMITIDGGLTISKAGAQYTNSGTIQLNNADLTLTGAALTSSGTLASAAGRTLTLNLPVTIPSGIINGPGALRVDAPNSITMPIFASANHTLTVSANLIGTGDTYVGADRELRLDSGGLIDRSGQAASGGCLDPNNPAGWGSLTLDGVLNIRNATLQNSKIYVHNSASISNCGRVLGGSIQPDEGSTVRCNLIIPDGDRFMDIPSGLTTLPIVAGNKVSVAINQDESGSVNGLYAPRSPSYANPVDGFNDNFALDEMHLLPYTRLNLLRRPGFEYLGPGDSLYVRNLILDAGATLNTGFLNLHYQTLTQGPGAQIVSGVPILGFSLVVIDLENDCEFDIRVKQRTADPLDPDPLTHKGRIQRIAAPLPNDAGNHAMELATHDPLASNSASSIAAHGAFARAGEHDIVVAFKYLFRPPSLQPPASGAAELVVYLTDSPEARDPSIPIGSNPNFIEIASIAPPEDPTRAGGLASGDFAEFHGVFPHGALNFSRGTFIELELRGTDAVCWIDQWDPQIDCQACADLNGTQVVDELDYLVLLSEYGQALDPLDPDANRPCLDSGLNGDKYIDLNDLLAWDTWLNGQQLNACGTGGIAGGCGGAAQAVNCLPGDTLVIAGKQSGNGQQEDRIYAVGLSGACSGPIKLPPSTPDPTACYRSNGRLLRDKDAKVYQIHASQGLIRLDSADVVLAPGVAPAPAGWPVGTTVRVGVAPGSYIPGQGTDFSGVPLLDAAFHPTDSGIVYVVPVIVDEPGAATGVGRPYKAAAKLQLLANGGFSVLQLYGKNPAAAGSGVSIQVRYGVATYEPDYQRMKEIELDSLGNVYVLSAHALNNNKWLLTFDETLGNASQRVLTIPAAVNGPENLLVSSVVPNRLYLTNSVYTRPNTVARLHRFNISRTGNAASGISLAASVDISMAAVAGGDLGYGYAANITSLSEHATDGRIFVTGIVAPRIPHDLSVYDPLYLQLFAANANIFTTPTFAAVGAAAAGPITAGALTCNGLALPISVVYVPGTHVAGDMNCDGVLNNFDIDAFVQALLEPAAWQAAHPACSLLNGDVNGDDAMNNFDIDPFVKCLLGG